jgi:gliding motility associated protien GldN
MKKYNLTFLAILFCSQSFSQDIMETDTYKMNNVYEREQHKDKEITDLINVREADVMWTRKIWREIDLRQKINHPLYYPQEVGNIKTVDRNNLFKILYEAATGKAEVSIRAFNAELDDEFQRPMTITELEGKVEGTLFSEAILDEFGDDSLDVNGNIVMGQPDRKDALNQADIKKWLVKEQWFFDKQRSVMDVRIIGLCPLVDVRNESTGRLSGERPSPICWFYFQEARQVLRNAQVFNLVKNEAENRTFEDIFIKRMFSSTIVKQGNVYDREIRDYMIGLDALLEAESIKAEIFNLEHDLWEY